MSFSELAVGHVSTAENGSGVSVFLLPPHSYCGWQLAGAAPATREVSLLEPWTTVSHVDAIVFSGGSAFGLRTSDGVMTWLKEQGRGVATDFGAVPIVPTAAIYDLGISQNQPPTAEDAYLACAKAAVNNFAKGLVGAGTGATVGKLFSYSKPMKGGLGVSEIKCHNGAIVRAYAVVNCVGDIIAKDGTILAGALKKDGEFLNSTEEVLKGKVSHSEIQGACLNTTLVAVFTNALFDKAQLARLAKMAMGGIGRAISPCFTRFDGDVVFCCSIDTKQYDEMLIGTMMSEAVEEAIRACRSST